MQVGGSSLTPIGDSTGSLGQPLVDAGVGDDHDDNDNDEELGADETNELVGQLIDYVSDQTLQS